MAVDVCMKHGIGFNLPGRCPACVAEEKNRTPRSAVAMINRELARRERIVLAAERRRRWS